MPNTQTAPRPSEASPPDPASLARAQRRLVTALVLVCVAAGFAAQTFLAPSPPALVGVAVFIGVALSVAGLAVRGRLLATLAGFRLATAALAALAAATALGTLIPQGLSASSYVDAYGAFFAWPVLALGLHDLFHAPWFGGLLGLVAAAVFLSAWRRLPVRWTNLGFFAVHLGLLATLFGAALSGLFGARGRLDLRVGDPPVSQIQETRKGVPTGRAVGLDASLSLLDFRIERHTKSHRLALYLPDRKTGSLRLKTTFAPSIGVVRTLPQGASLRVLEQRTPSTNDTAEVSPHRFALGEGPARAMSLGDTAQLADGVEVTLVRYFPHFTYDVATRSARSLDDEPVNPAVEITLNGERRYLFAKTGFAMGQDGPPLRYLYAPAAPPPEPIVLVELSQRGEAPFTRNLTTNQDDSLAVPGGGLVAFEVTPDEVKAFKSEVIVAETGQRALIAVNRPMKLGAWTLYQSSFDPSDPSRSGLEASRDPGVPWVFAGFGLIFFGVLYVFYAQPVLKRRRMAS